MIKDIAVAVLPVVAAQLGEAIREAITAKREADKCEHGRPGGRLCAKCTKGKAT